MTVPELFDRKITCLTRLLKPACPNGTLPSPMSDVWKIRLYERHMAGRFVYLRCASLQFETMIDATLEQGGRALRWWSKRDKAPESQISKIKRTNSKEISSELNESLFFILPKRICVHKGFFPNSKWVHNCILNSMNTSPSGLIGA